jgi:hypothetical protein
MRLPEDFSGPQMSDVIGDGRVDVRASAVPLSGLLAAFPVALLATD